LLKILKFKDLDKRLNQNNFSTYIEKAETTFNSESNTKKRSHMRNSSHLVGHNITKLTNFNPNENLNKNKTIINCNEENKQNLLIQVDLLTKEKNAIESQLVIIKIKYAELSSCFGELQDEKTNLQRKNEEFNQKLILKEEVISHLINEKEKLKTVNSTSSSANSNIYNNINDKTSVNDNPNTTREFNSGINSKNLQANYASNNNFNENLVKIHSTNIDMNDKNNQFNPNSVSYTQRNSTNELKNATKEINNTNFSNNENFAKEKIKKKIQYNFDEGEYSKRINYNTTMGNDYIESDSNANNAMNNKTEHEVKIENYRALQKNQKNKSFGLIGSIKKFFTNDKK